METVGAQQNDDWAAEDNRRRRHDDPIDSMLAANMFATHPSSDVHHAFAMSISRSSHRRNAAPLSSPHTTSPAQGGQIGGPPQQQHRPTSRAMGFQLSHHAHYQPQSLPPPHQSSASLHSSQHASPHSTPSPPGASQQLGHQTHHVSSRMPPRHLPSALPVPPTAIRRPVVSPAPFKREKLPSFPLPAPRPVAPRSLSVLMSSSPETLTPSERRRVRKALRAQRMARRGSSNTSPELQIKRPSLAEGAMLSALDKKTARVIRNREVALRARQAAKAKLRKLEDENSSLKAKASDLERENGALKMQIESLKESLQRGDNWGGDVSIESVIAP